MITDQKIMAAQAHIGRMNAEERLRAEHQDLWSMMEALDGCYCPDMTDAEASSPIGSVVTRFRTMKAKRQQEEG